MTLTVRLITTLVFAVLLFASLGQSGSCGGTGAKKSSTANKSSTESKSSQANKNDNTTSATKARNENMNQSKEQQVDTTAETQWGGNHVTLVMKAGGADLEFDCAHGEITSPIVLDNDGRFDVAGTFVRETGGPVPSTGGPTPRSARYVGQIVNGKMTLQLHLTGPDQTTETFELTRGGSGRLWKCR